MLLVVVVLGCVGVGLVVVGSDVCVVVGCVVVGGVGLVVDYCIGSFVVSDVFVFFVYDGVLGEC